MASRVTRWRRTKQFKENLRQLIGTTALSSNNKYAFVLLLRCSTLLIASSWLDPIRSDVPENNVESDLPTPIPSSSVFESERCLRSSIIDEGLDDKLDDELDDEPDVYIDQTWFEEDVQNTDPWENVEVDPAFQYLFEEKDFLFDAGDQLVLYIVSFLIRESLIY
jgi:hypothetical protein